jgi:hypothetical protein
VRETLAVWFCLVPPPFATALVHFVPCGGTNLDADVLDGVRYRSSAP